MHEALFCDTWQLSLGCGACVTAALPAPRLQV